MAPVAAGTAAGPPGVRVGSDRVGRIRKPCTSKGCANRGWLAGARRFAGGEHFFGTRRAGSLVFAMWNAPFCKKGQPKPLAMREKKSGRHDEEGSDRTVDGAPSRALGRPTAILKSRPSLTLKSVR